MSETFIDQLAKIYTIDPEKIFEGFYSLFAQIREMKVNELISAKQAIDLGLRLTEIPLSEKQETIIIEIITAMQQRAHELNRRSDFPNAICESLFLAHYSGWEDVIYDATQKKIVAYIPPSNPNLVIKKKSWFSFSRKPAAHDPLDV